MPAGYGPATRRVCKMTLALLTLIEALMKIEALAPSIDYKTRLFWPSKSSSSMYNQKEGCGGVIVCWRAVEHVWQIYARHRRYGIYRL